MISVKQSSIPLLSAMVGGVVLGGGNGNQVVGGETAYLKAPGPGSSAISRSDSKVAVPTPEMRPLGRWTAGTVAKAKVSSSLRRQILALNPDRISEADIQRVLSKAPAPQMINIHGGVYPVHLVMKDFSNFLAAMGYPKNQTRLPGGKYSFSCHRSSSQIAGVTAWYYEQTGMRVLMVGHSQGGCSS